MIKKHLAGILMIVAGTLLTQASSASEYAFERDFDTPSRAMKTYSAYWDGDDQILSLDSTWDNSKGDIDRVSFLLSDGGSPWLTPSEQFLFYDLDLVSNQLKVFTYFGRTLVDTFDNIIDITANGFEFSLDHTLINQMTFPGYSFNGAGFSDDIGIWYYMHSNGAKVETYDVHHGSTTKVPEPTTIALLTLGMLGFAARKKQQVLNI